MLCVDHRGKIRKRVVRSCIAWLKRESIFAGVGYIVATPPETAASQQLRFDRQKWLSQNGAGHCIFNILL